jgi:hypothetical protein
MIKWVLIVYLFNGGITPEEKTLDVEGARMCQSTCQDMLQQRAWEGRNVVHCTCKRASEYYASMATRTEVRFDDE